MAGGLSYYVLSLASFIFAIASPDEMQLAAMGVTVSLLLAGNAFTIGALRSYNNTFQEIRANLPWGIVCVLGAVYGVDTANSVFLYIAVSYYAIIFIEIIVVRALGIRIRHPNLKVLGIHLLRYRSWLPKALSTVGLAASIRSFPLWIGFLGYGVTDNLTYAFAIGEVTFQFCMIYVNQLHSSRRIQSTNMTRRLLVAILAFILIAITIPSLFEFALALDLLGKKITVDAPMLVVSSIYCASIGVFSLLRVLAWHRSSSITANRILVLQVLIFLIAGALSAGREFDYMSMWYGSILNFIVMILYLKIFNKDIKPIKNSYCV